MTKNELTNILKEIWDEKDFITGVQLCLSNDEERQMLADAITAGIIRNGGDIAQYAFCIRMNNTHQVSHPIRSSEPPNTQVRATCFFV